MAKPPVRRSGIKAKAPTLNTEVSSSIEELLAAAQTRGGESLETGRYLMTFKHGAVDHGIKRLAARGMRVADAREFTDSAVEMSALAGADAVVFPEVGVALISGLAVAERSLHFAEATADDESVQVVEPEYFVFSDGMPGDYLRGFLSAAEAIARDLGGAVRQDPLDAEVAVLGATWGINACKVPSSPRNGQGIKVAVLDTGFAFGHPDFVGRSFVSQTFVGQPVQDLHGHGTHCTGTACGPQSPAGNTPRYGIGFRSAIYIGKVLTNSGSSVGGSVLAGMNWAITNRCEVISMSLGSQAPVQAAYTNAGQAALNAGLLMVAAAGNAAGPTGAPANSPTIFSVASLDPNLSPSSFSNFGKIQIAAPGRDVFSSVPVPQRYGVKSGTSMAAPHVAGCAALWAQMDPQLRGQALWNKLLASAKALPFPAVRVGSGLVQAPQ